MFTLSLPYNLPNTQFVCVCAFVFHVKARAIDAVGCVLFHNQIRKRTANACFVHHELGSSTIQPSTWTNVCLRPSCLKTTLQTKSSSTCHHNHPYYRAIGSHQPHQPAPVGSPPEKPSSAAARSTRLASGVRLLRTVRSIQGVASVEDPQQMTMWFSSRGQRMQKLVTD